MKTQSYIFLLLTLFILACNSSDDSVTAETATYEFYEDAKMTFDISQYSDSFDIEAGTKTVFKYFFMAEDNEDISDDEYSESIYFEIDDSLDSFSYNNAELRNLNLFIGRSCFCAYVGFVFVETGSVSGTKLSNGNWDVDISMTFQWDEFSETETRNISGVFRPGEL